MESVEDVDTPVVDVVEGTTTPDPTAHPIKVSVQT